MIVDPRRAPSPARSVLLACSAGLGFAAALLGAPVLSPSTASAADDGAACTAETGWSDCEPIEVVGEPVELGDASVDGKVPTGLIVTPLEEGGPLNLLVADKAGTVRAFELDTGRSRSLIQIDGVGSVNPERGLLGLAMHPEFLSNPQRRRLYTMHTEPRSEQANAECRRLPAGRGAKLQAACALGEELGCGGASVLTEWTITDLSGGDPSSSVVSKVLWKRNQPGEGHNGGHLLFGPDGMLYASLGDGGGQMDPCGRGQDASMPYSAILRLDVNGETLVPADNPFVGQGGHEPLIWAYGLRNPWRMEFVPAGLEGIASGALLVGDTGQARVEEIDVVVKGGNYGWSLREGTQAHPKPGEAEAHPAFMGPLFQYGSLKGKTAPSGGAAVVGGVVYTGTRIPELAGHYLFGDNVTKDLWALDLSSVSLDDPSQWNGVGKVHRLKGLSMAPSTFARGPDGEVFIAGSGGRIVRLDAPEAAGK